MKHSLLALFLVAGGASPAFAYPFYMDYGETFLAGNTSPTTGTAIYASDLMVFDSHTRQLLGHEVVADPSSFRPGAICRLLGYHGINYVTGFGHMDKDALTWMIDDSHLVNTQAEYVPGYYQHDGFVKIESIVCHP